MTRREPAVKRTPTQYTTNDTSKAGCLHLRKWLMKNGDGELQATGENGGGKREGETESTKNQFVKEIEEEWISAIYGVLTL